MFYIQYVAFLPFQREQYKGNNDKGKASNELTNKAQNPYLTNKENRVYNVTFQNSQ